MHLLYICFPLANIRRIRICTLNDCHLTASSASWTSRKHNNNISNVISRVRLGDLHKHNDKKKRYSLKGITKAKYLLLNPSLSLY